MIDLLSGAKKWLLIGASLVMGALVFMLRIANLRTAAAKAQGQKEKTARKAVEATQEVERDVDAARGRVRDQASSVEQDLNQRRREGRRDEYGDPRLRRRSQGDDR